MNISHQLLKVCLVGILILGARPVGAGERMNVLLLIADDLNTWILEKPERYAGKVIAPNLQKLGESGMVFSHAYTASPYCVPSRTSMWSGVSPHRSGVYHNQTNIAASAPLKKAVSLFERFSEAGYSMYGYGKITHGWGGKDVWDEKQGHKRDPSPPGAPVQSVGKGEQDWGPHPSHRRGNERHRRSGQGHRHPRAGARQALPPGLRDLQSPHALVRAAEVLRHVSPG